MIIQEKLTNSLMKTYAETNGKRFYIKKIGTNEFYDIAIDLSNDVRVSKGLPIYQYEETTQEIETEKIEE